MRSRSDGKSTEETKRGGPIGLIFAKISCCGGMLLVLVGAQLWSAIESWFEDVGGMIWGLVAVLFAGGALWLAVAASRRIGRSHRSRKSFAGVASSGGQAHGAGRSKG